uniref:Uncharacterized protein n=1 Tax=Oreochromis aureus TaxID=47969 RepID=A0AAZ1XFY4_OREAU
GASTPPLGLPGVRRSGRSREQLMGWRRSLLLWCVGLNELQHPAEAGAWKSKQMMIITQPSRERSGSTCRYLETAPAAAPLNPLSRDSGSGLVAWVTVPRPEREPQLERDSERTKGHLEDYLGEQVKENMKFNLKTLKTN